MLIVDFVSSKMAEIIEARSQVLKLIFEVDVCYASLKNCYFMAKIGLSCAMLVFYYCKLAFLLKKDKV